MKNNKKIYLTTAEDRIKHFYTSKKQYQLTKADKIIKERLCKAYSFMLEANSLEETINLLQKDYKISEVQARNDVNQSLKLFGDVNETNTIGKLNLLYEYSMKTFQMSAEASDTSSMAKAIKELREIIRMQASEKKINKITLKQNNFIISSDPQEFGFNKIKDSDLKNAISKFNLDELQKRKILIDAGITDAEIIDDE